MKNFFMSIAIAMTVMFAAPSAEALTLQQQRNQTYQGIQDVASAVFVELRALQAERAASTDPAERRVLREQIILLKGRIRFLRAIQEQALNAYNVEQLQIIVNRFDLSVSLS